MSAVTDSSWRKSGTSCSADSDPVFFLSLVFPFFILMLFIFDTLHWGNFVWWSLLLELKKVIITMVLPSFIATEAKRKGSI